ncbi:MAG: VOC family protein [Flavobacterium sp.]|uniref:VOC family protein n=1 Tax=Flavobacterium sp. TaxID=239 RepID=UPI0022C9A300|nr:VOC family protein [Flavobacterium sp.]MCZ8196830.1 VOC family protein [Flavobacterium sp.]
MIPQIKHTEIILYVKDQQKSTDFYQKVLRKHADLNVPGMTEFIVNDFCKLGLMPNDGIAKIITPTLPHPDLGNGIPRCELYFIVENLQEEYQNIKNLDAKIISEIETRNWGDTTFYFSDLDGHVIAFAVNN